MKTSKHTLPTSFAAPRMNQIVGLSLVLILQTAWMARATASSPNIFAGSTKPVTARHHQPATNVTNPAALNKWTTNGPEGGTVRTLAVDPHDSAIIYAGTERRGVFKSIDHGVTWTDLSGGANDLYVDELVIDPHHPNTIFANSESEILASSDGGVTWHPSGNGLPLGSKRELIVDPNRPNTLYVNAWSAIYKSTDGSAHWNRVTESLGWPIFDAVAIAPGDSNVLYAGVTP